MRMVKSFDGKMIKITDCMGCLKAKSNANLEINPGDKFLSKIV